METSGRWREFGIFEKLSKKITGSIDEFSSAIKVYFRYSVKMLTENLTENSFNNILRWSMHSKNGTISLKSSINGKGTCFLILRT